MSRVFRLIIKNISLSTHCKTALRSGECHRTSLTNKKPASIQWLAWGHQFINKLCIQLDTNLSYIIDTAAYWSWNGHLWCQQYLVPWRLHCVLWVKNIKIYKLNVLIKSTTFWQVVVQLSLQSCIAIVQNLLQQHLSYCVNPIQSCYNNQWSSKYKYHFVYAPSQWETTLHCNIIAHWLGANTKESLKYRWVPL